MRSTLLITFLINFNLVITKHHHYRKSNHHHRLIYFLKAKNNFFSSTNENIYNIMNKLFESLDLADQFVETPKIRLLLTMLYDLNNIAGNNFGLYDVLKNITNVEANTKAINKIRLDEMVREIINENQSKVYNKTKSKAPTTVSTLATTTTVKHTTTRMLPMSEFKNSREFKQFIGAFLGKVNNLTVEHLFKKKTAYVPNLSRRNLKVWVPPMNLGDNNTFAINSRRIFKGKRTSIENFPFVVSIHILQEFMCAGNIISRDLVITAASCLQIHYNSRFFRENPKTTYVRIGSDWTMRRGELVPILEIYFYPTYDPRTLRHNIVILRLSRTIKFQARRRTKVRRIQLDRSEGNLAGNTHSVVIIGWGAKKPNQIVNNFEKLQVSFLDLYPVDECRQIYTKEYITDNNFCAGFFSKGGGACNRDVGGPGIVGGVLVGIVSFGPPVCGAIDSPTVFTRVGHYTEWIENIIQMRPPRYGNPKTTRMTSRAFIYYYNTMTTRTFPVLYPISQPTDPTPRAQYEINISPEETVLSEIITDLGDKNDSLVNDILDEAFTEEIYDSTTPIIGKLTTAIKDAAKNTTPYSIPGVEHEPATVSSEFEDIPTHTTTSKTETPIITTSSTSKQPKIITQKDSEYISEPNLGYDVYDNNNYESESQETTKPTLNEYDELEDSDTSRVEYIQKIGRTIDNDDTSEEPLVTEMYDTKHPLFIDLGPGTTPDTDSEHLIYNLK